MEIIREKNPIKYIGKFKRDYNFIPGTLYLGYGVNLQQPYEKRKVRVVDIYKAANMRSTHLICLGRTRWGKTRFIERAIVDDIESGFSIFNIDPKMDYENLEAILDAVIRTQRYDDFMLFSPYYSDISIRLNVFYKQLPDAISDIIKAMSPAGGEDFFREVGGELGKAVAIAEYLEGKDEIRFVDLFKYTSVEEIQALYSRIERADDNRTLNIGGKDFPASRLKNDAILSLKKIMQKDKTYWSKINTTIELVLSQISTGEAGEVFGRAYGNPMFDRMISGKPFIFVAVLGSLFLGKDTASKIARMVNAMHEKAYGWLYMKFAKLNPPISEFWDEGSVAIYDGAFEKINKVGGAGGYIHIFTQSFSDFELNVGREGTKVFFDNADVMLLSVLDQGTADYFSKAAGTIVKSKAMWTREEIIGSPEKVPLIPPEYFMRMRKGAFHAFIEGQWFRGYSPMLGNRRRIIIEPLPYPDERIVSHYAKKYKISEAEASMQIKNHEVYYDYDWIMKEKLADIWVDVKELPYYKNYVLKSLQISEQEQQSSTVFLSAVEKPAVYITKTFYDNKIRPLLNTTKGTMLIAFEEGSIIYIQFYTFREVMGLEPSDNVMEDRLFGDKSYKYVRLQIKSDA